jgi:hypothetical protein
MHDSGGKRDATVNALGPLIDDLKARGYEFVATHELVGRSRDSVMQPYRPAGVVEATNTQIRGGYIAAVAGFSDLILKIGIIATILGIARLLLIMFTARMQIRREKVRDGVVWRPDRISVLVPGYNEEKSHLLDGELDPEFDGRRPDGNYRHGRWIDRRHVRDRKEDLRG